MGWLWLVGSIKLYVSFAKETYKRADILQKRPIILSILLTVATPYHVLQSYTRAPIFSNVNMRSAPTPPIFTLQLFLDSLFMGSYFFQRRTETKTQKNSTGNTGH